MNSLIKFKKTLTPVVLIMGLWLVLVLWLSSITFLLSVQNNESMSGFDVILFELACITPWILSTPFIIRLARTYNFTRQNIYSSIAIHLLFASLLFTVHSIVQSYFVSVFYDEPLTLTYLQQDFLGFMDMRVMLYLGILLAIYAVDFHKKERESKLKEPRLRAQLGRARYQSMLNQIQPAFLLNSLDAIKQRVGKDPRESEQILTDFSDLLRTMLQNVTRPELTVREDIENFELYCEVLRKRLDRHFDSSADVEESVVEATVPSFLSLLPIIEEIVLINHNEYGGVNSLDYRVSRAGEEILIKIIIEGDNIPASRISGLQQSNRISEMNNTLQENYDEAIRFQSRIIGREFHLELTMPFKRVPAGIAYFNGTEAVHREEVQ